MRLLVFIYIVVTVLVAGQMAFKQMIWAGVALLFGALLGFVGGSGMRGAMYLGQRKSGVIIGIALLAAGMALVFYSDVTLRMYGTEFSGDVWVFIGFVVSFLTATREDAGVPVREEERAPY